VSVYIVTELIGTSKEFREDPHPLPSRRQAECFTICASPPMLSHWSSMWQRTAGSHVRRIVASHICTNPRSGKPKLALLSFRTPKLQISVAGWIADAQVRGRRRGCLARGHVPVSKEELI
jgi:hypothetical protein